ncbi:hypothetical protein [Tabrizicola sp. BL-A-41-H6]|uniref:hypothetical protein n=1 Tax=Tabrizicola sp. BL-A-41-H6 TaxID=3421107 RepID=UPI003D6772ED
MTTIITRLYPSSAAAKAAVDDLLGRGHSEDYIHILSREGKGTVTQRLRSARVSPEAAAAYAGPVADGKVLVVVQAPFNPIGAARHAIRVLDKHPSLDVGVANENEYIREDARIEVSSSILRDHPLFMSNKHRPTTHGHILGSDPIIHGKTKTSAIPGGAYMSTKFWPMKLLSPSREKTSARNSEWQLSRLLDLPTII